jgi:hypothetical protein
MMSDKSLLDRIQRLEDIEAIRRLKSRYFNACDRKDVDAIRACFVEGPAHIDYGVVGVFADREQLVQTFMEKGCHAHIVDLHHGQNAEIDITGPDTAKALWGLYFYQIDTRSRVLTQLGGHYEDEYRRVDGQWLISRSVFVVISSIMSQIDGQQQQMLFAGNPSLA